jgi:hypothetical protein
MFAVEARAKMPQTSQRSSNDELLLRAHRSARAV